MSRNDVLIVPAFLLLVAGVAWAAFGNPFALQGAKLQEFVGYIIGLLLAAVGLLLVTTRVVMTNSTGRATNPISSNDLPKP